MEPPNVQISHESPTPRPPQEHASDLFPSASITRGRLSIPRMDPEWWSKRVVVVTASVGMGHLSAAQGIVSAVKAEVGGSGPAILDVVNHMSVPIRALYRDGYLALARRAPSVLAQGFRLTDIPRELKAPAKTIDRILSGNFTARLQELAPDLIISTHFLASRVAAAARNSGRIDSTIAEVITDFDAHALWVVRELDGFFVAGTPALDRLLANGISHEKISLSGLPLRPEFRTPPSKAAAREALGLPSSGPVVLLTLGGLGDAPYLKLVQGLSSMRVAAHVVVVCGRNESARQELGEYLRDAPLRPGLRVEVIGFTDKMASYMAAADLLVGKPGGLTSSEAMALGLPMVIVNPIPGQEERNSDYLLQSGVAIRCSYPEQLGLALDSLLGDGGRALEPRRRAAQAIGKPNAAPKIINELQTKRIAGWCMKHSTALSLDALKRELQPAVLRNRVVVFDLDNTLLNGDIGDTVFEELSHRSLLASVPIRYQDRTTLERKPGESFSEFYRRALEAAVGENYDSKTEAAYLWMTQSQAGLTLNQILSAAEGGWQRAVASGRIGPRLSTIELLASCLDGGARPLIVSASTLPAVHWVVMNVLNPELRLRGIEKGILPSEILAVNNRAVDGRSSHELLSAGGAALEVPFTEQVIRPAPTFLGKALLVEERLPVKPLMVVGDSPNDYAMMELAEWPVLVARGAHPQYAERFLERFDRGGTSRRPTIVQG